MMRTLSSAEMVSSSPRMTLAFSASGASSRSASAVYSRLGGSLDRPLAEERQQQDFRVQRFREADRVVHPADGEFVALETVFVQPSTHVPSIGILCCAESCEIAGDQLGVVQRHLVVHEFAPEGDLDAIEAELAARGTASGLAPSAQVPIGDSDAEFGVARAQEARAESGDCCRTEQIAAGEGAHADVF